MSAETLRRAAEVLRGLIGTPFDEGDCEDFVIPGPWGVAGRPGKFEVVPELDESYDVVARSKYEIEATYIAMMHPGVGLALADWLDYFSDLLAKAEELDMVEERPFRDPLAVARLILGGGS